MKKVFIVLIVTILLIITGCTFVYVNRHMLLKKYPEQMKPLEKAITRLEILLGQENKKEEVVTEEGDEIIREPNESTSTSEYNGKKVFIKDGKLYHNLDLLDDNVQKDKNIVSVVNEWVYYMDNMGPVRCNIDQKIKQPLYYDLYDYFIVGCLHGYVVRDNKLFKLNKDFVEEEVRALPADTLVDVYKNSLIYTTTTNIYVVNLETDEEEEIKLEGVVKDTKIEDGIYKINTSTKSISIEV